MSEKKRAAEFTVVRERWLRGQPGSKLLDRVTGHMCCMGFYARACGFSADEIGGLQTLHCIEDPFSAWLEDTVVRAIYRDGHDSIYMLNDARVVLSEQEREQQITAALASVGIAVHFVDTDAEVTP